MRKLVSLALALLLALSALLLPAMAEEETYTLELGVLTMLNVSEAEMASFRDARMHIVHQLEQEDLADKPFRQKPIVEVTFFDTLDAMLMALNAGTINSMEVYASTARYLVHNNPELVQVVFLHDEADESTFARIARDGLLSNDFAFMFMAENAALRDEFDAALTSITGEEMDQLIQDNITAAINGEEVSPIQMPVIDGAETIRVAVTGSLPPMDYVAADGTPAGFNTALLAEISRRIGKNIELVIVDSMGRAAALASGTADAVFWTRTNSESNLIAAASEEEGVKRMETRIAELSDEEIKAMEHINEIIDYADFGQADMPEGTIITAPYFSDLIVTVTTRARAEN